MSQENLANDNLGDSVKQVHMNDKPDNLNQNLSNNIINSFLGIFEKLIGQKTNESVKVVAESNQEIVPMESVLENVEEIKVDVDKVVSVEPVSASVNKIEYPSPLPVVSDKIKKSTLEEFQVLYERNPRKGAVYFSQHSDAILKNFEFI